MAEDYTPGKGMTPEQAERLLAEANERTGGRATRDLTRAIKDPIKAAKK